MGRSLRPKTALPTPKLYPEKLFIQYISEWLYRSVNPGSTPTQEDADVEVGAENDDGVTELVTTSERV